MAHRLDLEHHGPIPRDVRVLLEKHRYRVVGQHSAVKRCLWLKKRLTQGQGCYKQQFYGIESHRCLQMTPAVIFCTHRCVFCWRMQPSDSANQWDDSRIPPHQLDDPEHIVEEAIAAQRRLLAGFNPVANPAVSQRDYEEALDPKHAAISLSGEPTLYPLLGQLIDVFHGRGLTTFLVTNGTNPDLLATIPEPTQLYISLPAANRKTYLQVCRPTRPGTWERLHASLEMIPTLSCPSVLRITLLKGYNMTDIDDYARLITRVEPTYIEPKAYVHVGWSQRRLGYENTPSYDEVKGFSEKLCEKTGYHLLNESPPSRVTLLSRLSTPRRFTPKPILE